VTEPTRYRVDSRTRRYGNAVIGGSPMTLFRLTPAGSAVFNQIEAGLPVASSTLVDRLAQGGAVHPAPDHAQFTVEDVTIVVPAFGARPAVGAGVLVVDDGSPAAIENATIRLDENSGPAVARNAGLELVTTPLVAFVDDDVELADGWLDRLLPHFNDPQVALVAPRVMSMKTDGALGRYERRHSPLDMGGDAQRVHPGGRVSYVPAAAIVCRADAIRGIGGFDPEMRLGEDVDLVWRLDRVGWRCRYEPLSVVHHRPRPTWSEWVQQRMAYGRSTATLNRMYPGAVTPLRMSPLGLAAWFVGASTRPVYGVAINLGAAAMLVRKLPDLPARAVVQLTTTSHLRAGRQIARAVRTTWWPMLAIASLRSRSARRVLLASALAAQHPIKVADDVAFSVGVWKGMIAERSFGALVPHVASNRISSKPLPQPSSPEGAR
jgi:mycofactocin system glycosyltransferase